MGYYASGGCAIDLRDDLTDEEFEKIDSILSETNIDNAYSRVDIDLYQYGKYYEDEWENLLAKLSPYAKDGYGEFYGEDNCQWRFVFRDGKFVEECGVIVYDDDPLRNQRIMSALKTMIAREENNLCLDSLYWLVRGAGLTDDDLKFLSLDYLIPVA